MGVKPNSEMRAAIENAKAAQPAWGAMTYVARATQLEPALAALEQNIDERAALYVRENGKTFKEAKGEHMGAAARQRLTLAYAKDLDQDRFFKNEQGRTFVSRRPYGVVVSIVPWNAPIGLAANKSQTGIYAQDSWKVTRKLTFDYGLRWDYGTYAKEPSEFVAGAIKFVKDNAK